jgi:hypothetical protein
VRILIDERIDEEFRHLAPGHDCQTARYAKLSGLKNGKLLSAAEASGFDVIVTVDQNMPYQQNLTGRTISLIVLCAPTNRMSTLKPLIPAALSALASIQLGQVVVISA